MLHCSLTKVSTVLCSSAPADSKSPSVFLMKSFAASGFVQSRRSTGYRQTTRLAGENSARPPSAGWLAQGSGVVD
ncbi:hypothetical protein I551_1494 [Mycobacterium ulcerans str. Harvey]|uniref:Secreted protein n=1 Tax=Mycobacterium ulcerans str. Harvey TaxID=1299332 RepID=A0ABN0R506_MYCUL|nr:hypothetical protein I551_1494 [Mycobacterium ulcerans str. Harvey]